MKLLTGRHALVTGVANGRSLAWHIARAYHAHGARVAITCHPSMRRRVDALAAGSGIDLVFPCDVQRDDDVTGTLARAAEAFDGRLHVLVHSVAFARLDDLQGEFIDVTRDGWRCALDVSGYSLVALARAARPLMRAAGGGSVVTLTFGGSTRVVPGYNVMGVAKAALEAAVRYLAYDLGPDGIRVNALSPGPVPTVSALVVAGFEGSLARVATHAPMLRAATADDVADVAVWCASTLSGGVTGAVIPVDGGVGIVAGAAGPHPRAPAAAAEGA
jgi:enoyl-[acyl-carrier protein] reductase I